MRILRVLPIVFGMTVLGLTTAPASAERVYSFGAASEYTDSISRNSHSRSNVGAMDSDAPRRAERSETRRSSKARSNTRKRGEQARTRSRSQQQARTSRSRGEQARRSTRRNVASQTRHSRQEARRTRTRNGGGESIFGAFGHALDGIASFYWQPQRVASGGWFNPNAMTAAHKTLPFGTRVRVTHLGNGRSVDVKINDRGPYIRGRIIDLSKAAAGAIGMQGQGVARVRVTVLGR